MGLFSFNKNKEAITPVKGSLKNIKVLGAGCTTCHKQYEYAQAACKELGLNIEDEYITDLEKIMEYGMMSMPLIVINDKVAAKGKLVRTADVKKLIEDNLL